LSSLTSTSFPIKALQRFLNATGLRYPLSIARESLRNSSALRRELAFRRRRRDFASRHPWISQKGPRDGKTILIVSLFDLPFMVEYEMALVKALEAHGARPVILASTRDRGHAYYRHFGADRVLFFDDFVRAAQSDNLPVIASLDRFKSMDGLREYAYEGLRVGRHALSLVSRILRQGRVTLSNVKIRREMDRLWPQLPAAVKATNDVFDLVKPDTAFFLEIGYYPYGELFETALQRGVDAVEWSGSHRLNCLNLKRYTKDTMGIHPQSLSPSTWERIKAEPWTPKKEKELFTELEGHYESGGFTNEERLQFGKKIKTREEVIAQLGLDPAKKTAVIFSHILWDATFFYGRDLFENYAEWLVETVRAAAANTNLNWVVKMHPANAWKLKQDGHVGEMNEIEILEQSLGKLPPHVKIVDPYTDVNTFALFSVTDFCLTVRGTIGIEMPCYGIPAIVAGTGRYAGYGFTNEFETAQDYLDTLAHLQTVSRLDPARIELAKKHAHALFVRRPLDLTSIEIVMHTDEQSGGLTERDTVLKGASLEEFGAQPDIRALADWVLDSREPDYLAPERP